jgi:hypothetical protein
VINEERLIRNIGIVLSLQSATSHRTAILLVRSSCHVKFKLTVVQCFVRVFVKSRHKATSEFGSLKMEENIAEIL